ncbi:MAG: hypothetical protein KJ622_08290 [Alphaproteobacteria bacterium]|nr:hypothetical protein [Alphaproteobacteria bacterium]
MSEVCVASDRFWREMKPDVAGTLSDEQRGEIERLLGQPMSSPSKEISDLRLSFKWFFIRLAWGPEKRNPDRVKQEQEMHPALSRRNAPLLASLLVGYTLFWYMAAALATLVVVLYMI